MNVEPQHPTDAPLRRLLTAAIGPDNMSDDEIESLLNANHTSMALSDEQTQRIVGKVNRLLNAAPKAVLNNTVANSAGPMLPRDQHPRLVSATTNEPPRPIRIPALAALLASMLALVSIIVLTPEAPSRSQNSQHEQRSKSLALVRQDDLKTGFSGKMAPRYWMTAKPSPDALPAVRAAVGDEIATGNLERRRVTLPDGSVLYVNSGSQVKVATARRVEVTRGEVFVEVVPAFENVHRHSVAGSLAAEHRGTMPFEVVTPNRTVTALGTKFSVAVDDSETDVMVTQGKVKVSGIDDVVAAGQLVKAAGEYTVASAPQASAELEWTRDLMAAATGPLVPKSEYSGGALVTVDPNGQSSKLSLRNYHIDVHIEDGFARTTIDQTYFNHTHSRLEGTFHFPLPTDASLSRLAMYVNGKLMEGGMAERDHARNTFEEIKRKMLDPALLEWVDGSTFKMRVFPLEPRQEKRIVLSYSQRLNSAEGQLSYRFPAGHTMDVVRNWSAHVRIKGGAGSVWHSQSHAMMATEDAGDLILDAGIKNALMNQDLVLRVGENTNLKSQISNFKSEGQQYLMLRLRPDLSREMRRQPHHWVFLFEHAGDRSPLLARTQIEIIRTLLENAEHSDTFSIVTASSRAALYADEQQLCSAENVAAAVKYLANVHLVGALDLAAGFKASGRASALRGDAVDSRGKGNTLGGLTPSRSPVLIHLGSGMPALGERDASKLAAMIPAEAQYVGIGVGRRWNQAMMKQAASRTSGLSTQINPDEEIAWRAFDVFSKLHSPRLVNLAVRSEERGASAGNLKSQISDLKSENAEFLLFSDTITHGEELAAICRFPEGQRLPETVTITAQLNGKPWTQTIPVTNVKDQATYLPRHWAKLEIDRLLAENAEQHRDAIVTLSKSMYVMSPFTSLLVLENEEMYTQFNIDRGRKDHWAMYPCPEQIEVVGDSTDETAPAENVTSSEPKTPADVMSTIMRIQRPQWFTWNLPQTLMADEYYRMRGIQDFDLESENRSLNFWGRAQHHGNMWFDDTEVRFRFDRDYDGNGNGESIRNESPPASLNFFDLNQNGNTYEPGRRLNGQIGLDFDFSVQYGFSSGESRGFERAGSRRRALTLLGINSALDDNEADVSQVRAVVENLEQESLEDMPLPVLLFGEEISPDERPASGFSEWSKLRRFGLPTSGSEPDMEARFFLSSTEFASAEPVDRLRIDNLSLGGIRLVTPAQQEVRITRQNSRGSHRWSADSIGANTGLVALPTFQAQSSSSVGVNAVLFGDLIAHAPGLNTSSADVTAVVEAERVAKISNLKSQISNPSAGRIEDAARALIESSRSRGWESIKLPGRDGDAGLTVHYDGQGRHVWERVVSEGLREHVVCDGSTLWHVYREIGLASKRPFSPFHHRDFTAIVPWLLPSADELARGADVVAVDERTIAIVPVSGTALAAGEDQNLKSEISDLKSSQQLPAAIAVPLALHLVFASDGRLAERQILEHASGKILQRIKYDADGTVTVLDGDDKQLASTNLHRSTVAAPQLVPELNGLVVLPMPVRNLELILAKESADLGQVGVQDADLSEDDAVSLMLAYMANGNGARLVEIALKRFIDQGDTRDGIYVLLSRFPQALVQEAIPADATPGSTQTPGFDLRPPVEGSPLKQFVRQYINWLRDGDNAQEFRIDAPEGSFLTRMATARNLYVRWLTDTATKDLTQAQVQLEVDRTLEFIASCRTLDLGWSLMSVMRPRLNTPEFLAAYSKAAERFEQHPQIGLLVRRERMTALFAAGKHGEARSLFKEWLIANLEQGFVPPIGTEIYNASISENGQQQIDDLLLECAQRLFDVQLLMTLHSLSVQMRELGNTHVADQMMTLLLASLDAKQRPDVSLCAIEQLRRLKDPRADKLLDQVMELPMAGQIPGLWRFAAKLAEDSGRQRLAAERLERAIQLEFATRPTVINIQTVRSDYTELLAKYEELLTASTTLEVAPPADLGARIVQAADQWRTLDDDDTAACQTASRLLEKLNSRELAWDYLTTPLAENSGESAPWIALARSLGTDTQTDLADMAWTQAFELESTNPEILLEHARLLQTAGRVVPAKELLRRAIDGTWQPGFAGIIQQCRDLLGSL